jgi:hypothetical protein
VFTERESGEVSDSLLCTFLHGATVYY